MANFTESLVHVLYSWSTIFCTYFTVHLATYMSTNM